MDTNTSTTKKLATHKVYDKTSSVKIPKMQVVKELHSDTRTSPIYLVKYEKKKKEKKP